MSPLGLRLQHSRRRAGYCCLHERHQDGDDVDVLEVCPKLDPVHFPLKTFMSDLILISIFSGIEQVEYLSQKHKKKEHHRLKKADEAWERLYRRCPQSPSSSSSESYCKEEHPRALLFAVVAATPEALIPPRAGSGRRSSACLRRHVGRRAGRGVIREVMRRRRTIRLVIPSICQSFWRTFLEFWMVCLGQSL